MTTSPTQPDLQKTLNQLAKRVRDLERRDRTEFPSFLPGSCLELFGEGRKTDPFRYELDISEAAANQIECTEDGLFVGGGQSVGWDAVVDASIVASDPDARLFQGIGEALTYLKNTVGLTEAGVAVRSGSYTETANWNTPATVRLFGIRGSNRDTTSGAGIIASTPVQWTWDGFRPLDISDLHASDIYFTPGAMTGHSNVGPFDSLTADNCYFNMASMPASTFEFCNLFYGKDCQFDFIGGAGTFVLALTEAVMTNCDVAIRGTLGASRTIILGGSTLIANGGKWCALGAAHVLSLPSRFQIDVQNNHGWIQAGGSGTGCTFGVPAGARGSIRMDNTLPASAAFGVDGTAAFTALVLIGEFRSITCTGAHESLLIDAYISGNGDVDIAGPAGINFVSRQGTNYTLRGNTIHGGISARDISGASGTLLSMVGCDDCNIQVAGNGSGASGTYKSFNLDANSDRNILTFAGDSTFPVIGTDAGTSNNIVRT